MDPTDGVNGVVHYSGERSFGTLPKGENESTLGLKNGCWGLLTRRY